jgi:hypothetical protein
VVVVVELVEPSCVVEVGFPLAFGLEWASSAVVADWAFSFIVGAYRLGAFPLFVNQVGVASDLVAFGALACYLVGCSFVSVS